MQRLDLVCGKNELNPSLGYVKINKDEVGATDGHILVIHKTSFLFGENFADCLPGDKDIFVHYSDWKTICKSKVYSYEYKDNQILTFDKKDNLVDSVPVQYDVKYPDLHLAVPPLKDCNKTPSVLGINAELLYNLSLGIYSSKKDRLYLDLKCSGLNEDGRPNKAVRVIPIDKNSDLYNSDVIAVIMSVSNN